MKLIEDQTFDIERAFYGEKDLCLKNCSFDGPADVSYTHLDVYKRQILDYLI